MENVILYITFKAKCMLKSDNHQRIFDKYKNDDKKNNTIS